MLSVLAIRLRRTKTSSADAGESVLVVGRPVEALRAWRKERAERDKVEPVVVLSTDSMRQIAAHACRVGGDPLTPLSDLKKTRYGEDVVRVVSQSRNGAKAS